MPKYNVRQQDNGVFYITWSEGRRSKRHSTGKTVLAEAQNYFARWLLSAQETAADAAIGFKIHELWALYRAKHVEKENASHDTADWSWKNLAVQFGELALPEVTDDKVQEYVKLREAGKIGQPAVSGTIRRELVMLRACLNWCAKPTRKIIRPADLPAFDVPPDSAPRDRWLRLEEVQRLLDAAAIMRRGDRLSRGERFMWLALETAARKGAILDLTWDRVDFETGVIHYDVPGRRKTKKRRASVPISKSLRPVLERAHTERANDLVLGNQASVNNALLRMAAHAKVDDVTPHVLRHTAATQMARRGVPLWKVAGILGNSISMVERVYAKHAPDGLADAVEMISAGMLEPTQ